MTITMEWMLIYTGPRASFRRILSKRQHTFSENIDPNGAGSSQLKAGLWMALLTGSSKKEVDLSEEEAISSIASTFQKTGSFPANYEDQLEKSGDTMPYARLIMDSGSTCYKNATVSLHAKKYDEILDCQGQWFRLGGHSAGGNWRVRHQSNMPGLGRWYLLKRQQTRRLEVALQRLHLWKMNLATEKSKWPSLPAASVSITGFPEYLIHYGRRGPSPPHSLARVRLHFRPHRVWKQSLSPPFLLTTFAGNLITTIVIETTSNSMLISMLSSFRRTAGGGQHLSSCFFAVKYRYVTYGDDGMPIEETDRRWKERKRE